MKVLQKLNKFIQLYKNIAESANYIFKIKSVASIRLVILDIPLGSITFYIILVNILFLLYLADIDNFRAFFNNIANLVI